jgi:hypothetical protein
MSALIVSNSETATAKGGKAIQPIQTMTQACPATASNGWNRNALLQSTSGSE